VRIAVFQQVSSWLEGASFVSQASCLEETAFFDTPPPHPEERAMRVSRRTRWWLLKMRAVVSKERPAAQDEGERLEV